MIGLGPNSGDSVDPEVAGLTASLTALLTVIADPEAVKARLAQLAAKSAEAKKALEEAKAFNIKTEEANKDLKEREFSLAKMAKELVEKEFDLKKREQKLAESHKLLDDRHAACSATEEHHKAMAVELDKRTAFMIEAERACNESIQLSVNNVNDQLNKRRIQLENEYEEKVKALKTVEASVNQKLAESEAIKTEAEKLKFFYEEKIAVFQKLVGGK